jgi:hypothetical protein
MMFEIVGVSVSFPDLKFESVYYMRTKTQSGLRWLKFLSSISNVIEITVMVIIFPLYKN